MGRNDEAGGSWRGGSGAARGRRVSCCEHLGALDDLVGRVQNVLGEQAVCHPVQVARLDLPHEHSTVRALHQKVIVQWTPLNEQYWEDVPVGYHYWLAFFKAQQRY